MEEKREIRIALNTYTIILTTSSSDENFDVDSITSIDYSNLYGEAVTVSALMNKIGLIKADSDNAVAGKKMELDIYEAELRKLFRKNMIAQGGKPTDQKVEDEVISDEGWQIMKRNFINAQRDAQYVDSLYWAIQSKDKKLSVLMKGTTPEDFEKEIIEGAINTYIIKKHKR